MNTFLILTLVFGILLVSPILGTAYGGTLPGGTTTWIGTGDGMKWSDQNNWNRIGGLGSQGPEVPQSCDLIIIDDGSNAVTVHFDLVFFSISHEMQIGSDDTLTIDSGSTLDHTPTEFECEEEDETIVNNGNLNVFGTLTNNGNFINNGQVLSCGTISGTVSVPGIVNECGVLGGEMIPIESVSLILAGAQSFSWMIPVVLSVLGIGLFVFRKSKNS